MPLDSNRTIDQAEFDALWDEADASGEAVWQEDAIECREAVPKKLGKGEVRTIALQPGLEVCITTVRYRRSLRLDCHVNNERTLMSSYYLAGERRYINPGIQIEEDRQENAGESCLCYLRDARMIRYLPAEQMLQNVLISVSFEKLRTFELESKSPVPLLRQLIQEETKDSFHQSLNNITPVTQQILRQIIDCPYRGVIKRMYLESKAIELLAMQFQQLSEGQKANSAVPKLSASDVERLQRARDILQRSFADPPSLLALAKRVELNDFKLKQGFRHLFGTTVFGYVQVCRMKQAQLLLEDSELSIADVAARVGYGGTSQFCNAFKRHVGMPPSRYRR